MTSLAVSTVELTVDGRTLGPDAGTVLAVRVTSRLAQPAECELTLAGGRGEWPHGWALGARLGVRVAGATGTLFSGKVTGVELARAGDGETVARVRGHDALHQLRHRQRLRVLEDATALDVAHAVAGDLGLTVSCDEPGPKLARVVQHRQSDLDLLVQACGRTGLYPVVCGDELRLVTLDGYGTPAKLHFGRSLWQASVEANSGVAARKFTAMGWHPQRVELVTETATTPRSGRRIAFTPPETADGELTLVDQPASGADEIAAGAQAALDDAAARAVVLRAVADGDPALWAGARIEVRGVSEPVDGQYVLGTAVHTVDAHGYQTTLSTEPPAAGAGRSGTSLTLGRVTAVDDPEKRGRVRVSLPAHGDLDVGWLAVVCPGAGKGKGIVALPTVDDTVAVALPHEAPAEGVVLGSLYGLVNPPDPGVEGNAVKRFSIRTAGGQSVIVDDDKKLVRVENDEGSYVELAPGHVVLHAKAELTIEAPGHAVKIRGLTVDFDRALV